MIHYKLALDSCKVKGKFMYVHVVFFVVDFFLKKCWCSQSCINMVKQFQNKPRSTNCGRIFHLIFNAKLNQLRRMILRFPFTVFIAIKR